MPSSHRRPAPATGRRTHTNVPASSPGSQAQPSLSSRNQDLTEELQEKVMDAYTQLNKVFSERDRYAHLYEQANKKLSESQAAKADLKNQVHALKEEMLTSRSLKEENAALKRKLQDAKRENKELNNAISEWRSEYAILQQDNNDLTAAFNAAVTSPSGVPGPSTRLPERPKPSHKEKKAEKERLSKRFGDNPPPPQSRRQSFFEPRGPGARPAPSAPGWDCADVPAPTAQTLYRTVTFSTVPRTANPLGSSLYQPGGGSLYDDGFEDGNYHAHPVPR
ncbi:putative coiled-coil protein [Hirsutella rhossiliensis]|uniref:Coiled-coil protein n=1 Tax=Hirsutella rhossiliensis TaxID=111463 RepID=A0A9P8N5B7_9HYPO|nr:putative coiled-coil protein [Hirsutella rhossiliensis]KAH0966892.1 putative coiled-coil protein [Hirsutella rhossiliensis]